MKKTIISLVVISAISAFAHATDSVGTHLDSNATAQQQAQAHYNALKEHQAARPHLDSNATPQQQALAHYNALKESQAAQLRQREAVSHNQRMMEANVPHYSGMSVRPNTGATNNMVTDTSSHLDSNATAQQQALAHYNALKEHQAAHPHLDSNATPQQQALAHYNALKESQAAQLRQREAVSHNQRMMEANVPHYSGMSVRPNTGATNNMVTETPSHLDSNATAQQQALAHYNALKESQAAQLRQQEALSHNLRMMEANVPHYSGMSVRPNTGATINVAANTLKPETRVQVTDQTGHKSVVKASTLTPSTQVSVPFHSAFQHVGKGGNSHEKSTSHVDHGTGTGADNAHDHAFGGHDGAGGGFHM